MLLDDLSPSTDDTHHEFSPQQVSLASFEQEFVWPQTPSRMIPQADCGSFVEWLETYLSSLGIEIPSITESLYHNYAPMTITADTPSSVVTPSSPRPPSLSNPITLDRNSVSPRHELNDSNKPHTCSGCGKAFHRKARAEGCENRHRDLRPYTCTKQCGNPNWYVTSISLSP
jgi:hypothetical protein